MSTFQRLELLPFTKGYQVIFLSHSTHRDDVLHCKKQVKKTSTIAPVCVGAKSCQSHLTLCNHVNCSLPGSSTHGIPQASILEQFARPFSRGSSRPRVQTHMGRRVLYHQCHLRRLSYLNPFALQSLFLLLLYSLIWEFMIHHQFSCYGYLCTSSEFTIGITRGSVTLLPELVLCT